MPPAMIDPAAEFPLADDIIYLNHAAVAPLPRRARQRALEFLDDAVSHGAAHYPAWLGVEAQVRQQLAKPTVLIKDQIFVLDRQYSP